MMRHGASPGAGPGARGGVWAGLLVLVAACDAPPRLPQRSIPLLEIADTPRVVVETDAIDVGAREHRHALWSGWGPDESYAEGSFAWGAGQRSLLRFDVVEPRDRSLRLRGWSFPFGDAPVQNVRFAVGGREIAQRKLAPEPSTIEISVPKEVLRVGENFLELSYGRHADGALPWAAGWDSLRFDGPRAGAPPRIERGAGRIVLPARTALEWTTELPGGSWLAWRNLVATGDVRLAVTIVSENDRRDELPNGRAGRLRLSSEGAPHRLHTVALRALGDRGELRLTGVRLHASDLGALAAPPATAASAEPASPAPSASLPNLLVYVIDTLRADHLGCYGYQRPTSPAIDDFAAESLRWHEGRAQASWTRPAMASILTGLYPIDHRVLLRPDKLPRAIATLADRLRAAGYETAFFTPNANTSPHFGFDRGWDVYSYEADRALGVAHPRDSARINAAVFDYLGRREASRPFFLVVHTMDPHDAYVPREPFRSRLAGGVADPSVGTRPQLRGLRDLRGEPAERRARDLIALYDGEIAQNDASFGALLAELERRGLGDTTAVLLTSDHGEEFFEHGGWRHGYTLYEEQLRIPMLLRLPGRVRTGRVLHGAANQVDIAPTLLELAALPPDPGLPGRSLLAEARGTSPPSLPSFAWLERPGLSQAAVVRQQWKLIRGSDGVLSPTSRPPAELFALASDPEERRDRALEQPLRRFWLEGQLAAVFGRWRSKRGKEEAVLDAEADKTLRALGYL